MRRTLVASCLAATLLVALQAAPGAAISAIPAETSFELRGRAVSAIVGDLDADGVRELVRVVPWQTNPGQLAVEITTVDEDGATSGAQALIRRGAIPDEVFDAGPQPDGSNMLPVGVGEPARLLAWHRDGVERVIVAAIGAQDFLPCCLTVWEVLIGPNGAAELRLLTNTQASGNSIRAVDLDGDGTDELVITDPPEAIRPAEVLVRVLRWEDGEFSRRTLDVTPAAGSLLVPLGDSDGRPGEELGMIGVPETAPGPARLHRISLDDDGLPQVESGVLPFLGELAAMPGAAGGRIVLASSGEGLRLLRWPAGGGIEVEASSSQRGVPMAVIGTGSRARLLLRDGGIVRVVNERLQLERSISRTPAAARFRNSRVAPYTGTFPGGLPDVGAALVFRGRLMTLAAAGDGLASPIADRPMAAMPGLSPIGALGPGQAWTALAASIVGGFVRDGGQLSADASLDVAAVRVVRTEDLLSPEEDDGILDPVVVGVIRDDRSSARPVLLASGPFEVEVAGPPGTLLFLEGGSFVDAQRDISRSGAVRLDVSGPDPLAEGDERFALRLQAVTPAGHGYVASWGVQILREPPRVAASTPVAPLSFNVQLTGRTEPGATVLLDGAPVAVQADGSFSAEVFAGPIPRDVRIEASDVVGNTTRHTVSVVGFIDFRRLPWIPIVLGLTVLIGILLYLRVPRPARPAARPAGDDASLEEIE
jgi:hypothetical protein